MSHWVKQGLLYALPAGGLHPKLKTHAANPLPVLLHGDTYRFYFSARDDRQRSSIGAVDIDIVARRIVCEHREPFFEHGAPGSYFEHGVSIGNCYECNGVLYMLFMGWQSPPDAHWRGEIGRLIVSPDFSLRLDGTDGAPFMGRDPTDPVSLSYPWVMRFGDKYRMWYPSTVNWDAGNGEMLAVLHVAESLDGQAWERLGLGVPYEVGRAQAFSHPCVVGDESAGYRMWFSHRGSPGLSYRIGTAHSQDAKNWTLQLDDVGIDVSAEGWDSEMIEYPFVFDHLGQRYMVYNGNGYGLSGFGLAQWQAEGSRDDPTRSGA